MKFLVKSIIAVFILLFCNLNANAQTTYPMYGAVGKYKIVMVLEFKDHGIVSGWYYYKSKGPKNKIKLNGTYKDEWGNFEGGTLNLTESVNGKITGYFSGEFAVGFHMNRDVWAGGTWKSPKGNTLKWEVDTNSGD